MSKRGKYKDSQEASSYRDRHPEHGNPIRSEKPRMRFGKYKGQLMSWVKENDPKYFQWCLSEVKGFQQSLPKGIMPSAVPDKKSPKHRKFTPKAISFPTALPEDFIEPEGEIDDPPWKP